MNDAAMASRRDILRAAAAAGLAGSAAGLAAAEAPPETKRLRLVKFPSVCQAFMFVAEELLRTEGFTDISYVDAGVLGAGPASVQVLSEGKVDMGAYFAAPLVIAIDCGAPISVLGGVHPGCFELFTAPGVRSIKDLKGRTVSVFANESAQHVFLASIATSVGLDPLRDIQWVFHPPAQGKQLRNYNPEETLRFYALRLREAGMVKNAPQKIIANGTDWRILEQLKREMKS